MDKRALPCIGLGTLSLAFAIVAAVAKAPLFAASAGLGCALLAVMAVDLTRQLRRVETEATTAIELMMKREVEHAARVKQLEREVLDPITNLPDKTFFELATKGAVASARRHLWPVSIVFVEVTPDLEHDDGEARASTLALFTDVMNKTLREADIACRIDDCTFGLILEDTAEEGGVWTAERLQIAIAKENTGVRQLSAGVATYPTHGMTPDELVKRGETALAKALTNLNTHGLGQVEVARGEGR